MKSALHFLQYSVAQNRLQHNITFGNAEINRSLAFFSDTNTVKPVLSKHPWAGPKTA